MMRLMMSKQRLGHLLAWMSPQFSESRELALRVFWARPLLFLVTEVWRYSVEENAVICGRGQGRRVQSAIGHLIVSGAGVPGVCWARV